MEKALIRGLMVEFITAIGKIIKCMAEASSPGPMVENMKASTTTIKSRVMVFFTGRMDDSTTASGMQASSKASAFTSTPKARYAMAAGKTASA